MQFELVESEKITVKMHTSEDELRSFQYFLENCELFDVDDDEEDDVAANDSYSKFKGALDGFIQQLERRNRRN